jgi:hypothetical protein
MALVFLLVCVGQFNHQNQLGKGVSLFPFHLSGTTPPTDLDSLLESNPVPPTPGTPPCAVTCTLCSHDATTHAHSRATRGPVDPACAPRGPVGHACATRGPIDHACVTRGPDDPACATCGPVDHACATRGPVDHACATHGPVDHACATRGPDDPACATRGPVDPGSVRQPHARLPPPWPRHYLRAPRLGPVDERDPLRQPCRRLSPPRAGHTRRSRRSGGPL